MGTYAIIKISLFLIFCTLIRSLQLADQGQIIKQEHKNIKSKIYLGEEKQIIQLSQYGSVINQHLDNAQQIGEVNQCNALRQYVNFSKKEQLELIQDYTENQFRSHYKEGAFQGDIPRIISYSPIKYGAAILTSQGELFLVSLSQLLDGPDRIVDHIVLEQHLSYFRNNKKTYMVYFEPKNELLISLSEVTILIKIDRNKFQKFNNVITGIDQGHITHMKTIEDLLIISMGQQGFVIGQIEMDQNHSKFKALFYVNEVYAMQSKAIKQQEGEYLLYILDFEQGVKVYNFTIHIIEAQIIDIHLIDISPIGGSGVTSFDVYGNSLLVVKKYNDYYKVTDYHTLIGLKQWTQLNEWIFESEIKSVNLSKDFAIILGQSGHHILYHSINKSFYNDIDQKSEQPLYFPNLRTINFFERDDMNLIYGITRDKFFIAKWELHPIQIICQSNSFQDTQFPILMNYQLNSTNCPYKIEKENDMQMCQTQIQLEVTFIYPILDATKKNVLATSLIIIFSMIVILLAFLMRKFLAYRGKANLISREINKYTYQGHILPNDEIDDHNQSAPKYVQAQLDSNQTPNQENLVPVEKEQI